MACGPAAAWASTPNPPSRPLAPGGMKSAGDMSLFCESLGGLSAKKRGCWLGPPTLEGAGE